MNNLQTSFSGQSLFFAIPIIFYRILTFSAFYHYFVDRIFPLGFISLFFDLVNNPENSNLAIFSVLGRNNTQSFKNQKQCQHFLNDTAVVSDQWIKVWFPFYLFFFFPWKWWLFSKLILTVTGHMVKNSKALVKQEVLPMIKHSKYTWIRAAAQWLMTEEDPLCMPWITWHEFHITNLKNNKEIRIWSSNPTLGYFSKRIEIRIPKRHLHCHVQCSISHSSQDVEAT